MGRQNLSWTFVFRLTKRRNKLNCVVYCVRLLLCPSCDAIHVTVNVYDAAADRDDDDSDSKMNIFL